MCNKTPMFSLLYYEGDGTQCIHGESFCPNTNNNFKFLDVSNLAIMQPKQVLGHILTSHEREKIIIYEDYLSSIKHKNLTPYRFVAILSQITCTNQMWVFKANPGVKSSKKKILPGCILFQGFLCWVNERHT
jgi:hypothetical protein